MDRASKGSIKGDRHDGFPPYCYSRPGITGGLVAAGAVLHVPSPRMRPLGGVRDDQGGRAGEEPDRDQQVGHPHLPYRTVSILDACKWLPNGPLCWLFPSEGTPTGYRQVLRPRFPSWKW